MPNYKLSPSATAEIILAAGNLADHRRSYALTGFPLTVDQIEAATVPADILTTLHRLKAENVECMNTTGHMHLRLADAELPGVTRTAVLGLSCPGREPYYVRRSYWGYGYSIDKGDAFTLIALDPHVLGGDLIAKLVKWTNNAVRECRLYELTMWTVHEVMKHTPTAYHIQARWPVLATLAPEAAEKQHYHRRKSIDLRTKLREIPTRCKAYAWPAGEPDPLLAKRMAAAEMVLLSAKMLPPVTLDPEVRAKIVAWQKLPGDATF